MRRNEILKEHIKRSSASNGTFDLKYAIKRGVINLLIVLGISISFTLFVYNIGLLLGA